LLGAHLIFYLNTFENNSNLTDIYFKDYNNNEFSNNYFNNSRILQSTFINGVFNANTLNDSTIIDIPLRDDLGGTGTAFVTNNVKGSTLVLSTMNKNIEYTNFDYLNLNDNITGSSYLYGSYSKDVTANNGGINVVKFVSGFSYVVFPVTA
jgi:hypothetical protein